MNDEIKEILGRLEGRKKWYLHQQKNNGVFNDDDYMAYMLLDYITNLQQENEDNLKCIKNLKEQLESVIKNNQELLEKWHKNNDKIVNLISENERLKENNSDMQEEMARVWEENERLKQDYINVKNYIKMRNVSTEVEDKALLYNIELENINKKKYLDYKSRCEKAIEYIQNENNITKHGIYPNYTYEVDTKDLLNILQNGSEKDDR